MSKKLSTKSKKVDREIEIQIQVENILPLLKLLKEDGRLVKKSHQVDTYYTPAHRDFTDKRPVSEWLRVRNEGEFQSITYKNWYTDAEGRNNWCDEYETSMANADQFKKILKSLNFKEIAVVDKKRESYLIDDFEVSIDKIKSLGTFVEIEHKGDLSEDPDILLKETIDFIKSVGVGKIVRNFVGYPYMLLFPNEIRDEEL